VAPLPPVANVIRLQIKHTLGDDFDVLDRVYLTYAGDPPTNADLNAFCTTAVTTWSNFLAPMAHPNVILTEMLAQDLSSDIGAIGSDAAHVLGTRSGGALPAEVVSLINFQIARRYRGGKPRIYLPYGTDGDVLNPQSWTSAFVTALTTAWSSFMSTTVASVWSGGGPMTQTSVSYYLGSTELTTGTPPYVRGHTIPTKRGTPTTYLVTSFTVNPIPASQRRRERPG
jgi:hypothetical protein